MKVTFKNSGHGAPHHVFCRDATAGRGGAARRTPRPTPHGLALAASIALHGWLVTGAGRAGRAAERRMTSSPLALASVVDFAATPENVPSHVSRSVPLHLARADGPPTSARRATRPRPANRPPSDAPRPRTPSAPVRAAQLTPPARASVADRTPTFLVPASGPPTDGPTGEASAFRPGGASSDAAPAKAEVVPTEAPVTSRVSRGAVRAARDAGGPTTHRPDDAGHDPWLRGVHDLFAARARGAYPARARLRRLEGRVTLAATLDHRGRVRDVRIARSSGAPSLDEAAHAAIASVARVPAPPPGLDWRERTFQFVVDYRLR